MPNTVLNYFEESTIKNKKLPHEWRNQSSLDDLYSFLQNNWEQRSVFFSDREITSRQQFVSFTSQQGIRTNNYIGTVVFKGQQLNIFPKVFREDKDDYDTDNLDLHHLVKNLVQWLQYCNRINYPFIAIKSQLEDCSDLRDLLITLYLHYVNAALKRAPFYQYVDLVEDTETVKGHINVKDYVTQKIPFGKKNIFQCSFSEFQFDNSVNRILKYTCRSLANSISSLENKHIIRNILIRLNEVSDVYCTPSDCDSIHLSKMHQQYSILLSMSKIFLLNQATTYEIDNQESFCFLFPTEILFEGFIGGFMEETLNKSATVRLQASELTLISDIKYDGQSLGKAFTMRHDILVEHKELGIFVLDTKYKHLSRFEGNTDVKKSVTDEISQADLYQVIEYATHRDLDKVYLLYPMYRYEQEEPTDIILERKSQAGIKVQVHVVRLPFIFEDDIEKTKKMLRTSIHKIFS